MRYAVPLLVVCVGCGDPITAKGAGESANQGSDWDWDADPGSDDTGMGTTETDVRPSIQFAQALCDAGGQDRWKFTMTASDPQGLNTLDTEATVTVLREDEAQGSHVLAIDDSLRHTATVSASEVGISCSNATQFEFSFTVSDQDGNESDPKIVTGEEE